MAHTPGQVPLPPGSRLLGPPRTISPLNRRLRALPLKGLGPIFKAAELSSTRPSSILRPSPRDSASVSSGKTPTSGARPAPKKLEATRSRSRANSRTTQRCTRGSWPMNSATPLTPDYR